MVKRYEEEIFSEVLNLHEGAKYLAYFKLAIFLESVFELIYQVLDSGDNPKKKKSGFSTKNVFSSYFLFL